MKHLVIRVQGSKRKPFKIQIHPGSRTRDILTHLNLADYVLVPASDPTMAFFPEEEWYGRLLDADKLIARKSAEATASPLPIFFTEEDDNVN